jgi:serine/threonine protein kinase
MNREERNFNEALQLETEAAMRAARVVAKARREALEAGKTQTDTKVFLEAINATLNGMDKKLIKALRAEGILEKGYRQGKAQVRGLREGGFTGFEPMIDPYVLAQETSKAVDTMKGVGAYAKEIIKETIEIGLARGEGAGDLLRRLTDPAKGAFKMTQRKAEMRARTISNDLVNAGKQASYRDFRDAFPDLGINNQWYNISDSRSSDVCKGLNGEIRPIGSPFSSGHMRPPAHPYAYLPGSLVITPLPELLLRMWYEGEVITIVTQLGNKLTVTHEHPVLTTRGFIKAGELNVGDHIFELPGVQGGIGGAQDDNEPVPTIEDCFGLESVLTPNGVMPATTVDLDSDIPYHKIDIIGTYRALGEKTHAFLGEKIKNLPFIFASGVWDTRLQSEPSRGRSDIRCPFSVSPSLVSREGSSFPFLEGSSTIEGLMSLGVAPEVLARLLKDAFDNTFVPLQESSDGISRDSGEIERDDRGSKVGGFFPTPVLGQIVEISVSQYSGHVYHLQDSTAFQCASGIITHNCRSTILPTLEKPSGSLNQPQEIPLEPEKPKEPPKAPEKSPKAPKKPKESPKAPEKPKESLKAPEVDISKIFYEGELLGAGAFGRVYALDGIAIKLGQVSERELETHRDLGERGIAAKVLSELSTFEDEPVYAMEELKGFKPVRGNMGPYVLNQAAIVMHKAGYVHEDLHGGNVLMNPETGEFKVLDFGLTEKTSDFTRMVQEYVQTPNRNPSKADKKIRELIKEGDSLDRADNPKAARAKWAEAGERYKEFLETQPDTRIVPEEIREEAIFIPVDPQGNPKKKAGIFGKPLESDSMGLKDALADFEGSPDSLGNFDDLVDDLADILGVAEEPPKKPPEELKKPKKLPKEPKKPPKEPQKTPESLESPGEPVDLARIVEEGARLGGGAFGQVFALGGVAVKKGAISSDEPRIQRILADAGLSPKVLSEIGEVNGERAYAMEALDSGFQPASRLPDAELAPVMIGILMKVHGQGVVHWDFHSGNVMYNKATGETQVIDFGMSKSDSVPTRLFQEFASTALRLDRWHGATPEMFPKDIAGIFKKALKIQALLDEGKFEEVKKLEVKAAKAYWKIIDPDKAPGKKPKES